MLKLPATLLICSFACAAHAQPNLIAGSLSHLPGEVALIRQCQHLPPGNPGANQTWNFNALSCGISNPTIYVAPGTTDFASEFPTATAAVDNYPVQYYEGNATGYYWLGEAWGDSDDLNVVTCDGGKEIITYPFTMGSTLYDYSACPYDYNNGTWGTTLTKIVDAEADGYGTLLTPYGTITNVLRIHWNEHGGSNSSSYDHDAYWFVKPGIKEPIVAVWIKSETQSGQTITAEYSTLVDQNMVGVEELLRSSIGVDLHPVPATDHIDVTLSAAGGQVLTIAILDANGQVCLSEILMQSASGIDVHRISLPTGLTPGLHVLRVTDASGASGAKRFLKL